MFVSHGTRPEAVGRRFRDCAGSEQAAGAGAVVDHDLLAKHAVQAVRQPPNAHASFICSSTALPTKLSGLPSASAISKWL